MLQRELKMQEELRNLERHVKGWEVAGQIAR